MAGFVRLSDSGRIILSRALTNSGDQAWDFAVPISLAVLLPGRLDLVALTFFLAKLGNVVMLPWIGGLIDRLSRISALRMGLVMQFVGVYIQAQSISLFHAAPNLGYAGLIVGGIASGLGSAMSGIAVSQDLVPSLFKGGDLTRVNSRIRQLDLFAEVVSPVVAGALLLLSTLRWPHAGLWIIAIWNLISFAPEYFLLRALLARRSAELEKPKTTHLKVPLWRKLGGGWLDLTRLPIAPVVFAYTLLWLSALSPHGVLLTSYLKESWQLPELVLGIFRGLGAIFGLSATLLFPLLVKRWGLMKTCRFSVIFQAAAVCIALWAFESRYEFAFLAFVLISRIGLYAFSLGEQQVRQEGIPVSLRGSVNATAGGLTSLATLLLLGLGSLLGRLDQFPRIMEISVACVVGSAVIMAVCSRKSHELLSR